jgi:hypothetical protein
MRCDLFLKRFFFFFSNVLFNVDETENFSKKEEPIFFSTKKTSFTPSNKANMESLSLCPFSSSAAIKIVSLEELKNQSFPVQLSKQSLLNRISNDPVFFNSNCNFPASTVVDYVSLITNRRITIQSFYIFLCSYSIHNTVKNGDQNTNDAYQHTFHTCKSMLSTKSQIELTFIAPCQQLELISFFQKTHKEDRSALQSKFVSHDTFFNGCSEKQIVKAKELLSLGQEVPAILSEEKIKSIQSIHGIVNWYLWGSQFKEILRHIGEEPVKLIDGSKKHNNVEMVENKEIVDPVAFSVQTLCSGGIYGTFRSCFLHWTQYRTNNVMEYIAEMEILDESQVVVEEKLKFKVDRMILRNMRFISDLEEWKDDKFIDTACRGTHLAASFSSLVPALYKLSNFRSNATNYIANKRIDWNHEPLVVIEEALRKTPRLVLQLQNPAHWMKIKAIMSEPRILLELKQDEKDNVDENDQELYETACIYSSFSLIKHVPLKYITRNLIKIYPTWQPHPFHADIHNIETAMISFGLDFFQELLHFGTHQVFFVELVNLFQNAEFRDACLMSAIPLLVQNTKLSLHYVTKQSDAFQKAYIAHPDFKNESDLQFLKNFSEEVIKLCIAKFPHSFRFFPSTDAIPWTSAQIIDCALHKDSRVLWKCPDAISAEVSIELAKNSQVTVQHDKWDEFLRNFASFLMDKLVIENEEYCFETVVRLLPEVLEHLKHPLVSTYETVAVEAAILAGTQTLHRFWTRLVGSATQTLERISSSSITRMLETDSTLILQIPRGNKRDEFPEIYHKTIIKHIQKDPDLFASISKFCSEEMIDVALEGKPSNMQYLTTVSHERQRDAILKDPRNIRFIKNPGEFTVCMAVQKDPLCIFYVQNYHSTQFQTDIKASVTQLHPIVLKTKKRKFLVAEEEEEEKKKEEQNVTMSLSLHNEISTPLVSQNKKQKQKTSNDVIVYVDKYGTAFCL